MERDFTERISARVLKSGSIRKISAFLNRLVHRLLGAPAMRRLKIFLNGTWIGHPLHPMLKDIPIGAWTLTILLDLIGLSFGFPQLGLASSITVGVGVAGALAAAAAGLADWMDVNPPEKAIGAFHASLNIGATIFFLVSFLMRWGRHW